jgi:hypothetical protein
VIDPRRTLLSFGDKLISDEVNDQQLVDSFSVRRPPPRAAQHTRPAIPGIRRSQALCSRVARGTPYSRARVMFPLGWEDV